MNIWIIVGSLLVFGVITFLSKPKSAKKKTRKELLEELADTLEGRLTVIEDRDDCYSISFEYEKCLFTYEDIKEDGFNQESYKAYLRIQSTKIFNLSFIEKRTGGAVKTAIRIASEMTDDDSVPQELFKLPSSLDDFKLVSDDNLLAKKLLENDQVVKVLNSFKKVSSRGMGIIPLRILGGDIIFEFEERDNFLRRLSGFSREIDFLEECAGCLKIVYDALEKCNVED